MRTPALLSGYSVTVRKRGWYPRNQHTAPCRKNSNVLPQQRRVLLAAHRDRHTGQPQNEGQERSSAATHREERIRKPAHAEPRAWGDNGSIGTRAFKNPRRFLSFLFNDKKQWNLTYGALQRISFKSGFISPLHRILASSYQGDGMLQISPKRPYETSSRPLAPATVQASRYTHCLWKYAPRPALQNLQGLLTKARKVLR